MEESVRKYFQGELSLGERLELLRRAEEDAALKATFIRHQHLLALLALAPVEGDAGKTRAGYDAFVGERRRKSVARRRSHTLRYAAAILCLTLGTWTAAYLYFSADNAADETVQTLHVPAGQRISLTLADGTVVWMNARTTLTYPTTFRRGERRVALEGEAWFDVARDTEKPFIVSSGNMEVKVLGTSFNMYSYPGEAFSRISLVEGSLQVSARGNDTSTAILQPNDEATVRGSNISVTEIPDHNYFLWIKGIYSFENETFENILKKLELYYDIRIDMKDAAMLQWRYTVKFRQRDGLREILRLMQQIHRFRMMIDEENNTITIIK
ncbi:MAG: FecR domain-containing protein [Tannerella sp.]|jgi:ferric-dicitrate binding protein FerR (iron transport regulator)|nr:FecR domain-containing protein [Tannerella sp.]